MEGNAEGMENVSRDVKEETCTSGKREVEEEEREKVEVNSKQVCFGRSLCLNSRGECFEMISDSEVERCLECS